MGNQGVCGGTGSRREKIEASEAGGCFQEEEERKSERRPARSEANTAMSEGFCVGKETGRVYIALLRP